MPLQLPSDIEACVGARIESGRFETEADVLFRNHAPVEIGGHLGNL